jgi:hypothetical protein
LDKRKINNRGEKAMSKDMQEAVDPERNGNASYAHN